MRTPINLPKIRRVVPGSGCPHCQGTTTQVDVRPNSLIWYCTRCDVYNETTPRGASLRSYRKEADQIINIALPEEQP